MLVILIDMGKEISKTNAATENCTHCGQLLQFCGAMCCRPGGGVALTREEIASGIYETEHLCMIKREPCLKDDDCFHKLVQIKARDGSCFYLGADNLCRIYDRRPKMCRDYLCAALGGKDWHRDPESFLSRETLRLSPGQVFAPVPGRILKRIILDEDTNRIFFMISDNSLCEDEILKAPAVFKGVGEDIYNQIAALFDGERSIREIEEKVEEITGATPGDALLRFVILCNTLKVLRFEKRPACGS